MVPFLVRKFVHVANHSQRVQQLSSWRAVGNHFWRQTSPGMRFQLLLVGGLFIPRVSPTRHTCLSIRSILLIFKRDRGGGGGETRRRRKRKMETRKTAIPERFSLSRSLCLVHTRRTRVRSVHDPSSKDDVGIRSVFRVRKQATWSDRCHRLESVLPTLRRRKLIEEDLISNHGHEVSLVVVVVGHARAGGRAEGKEGIVNTVRTARDTRLYEE